MCCPFFGPNIFINISFTYFVVCDLWSWFCVLFIGPSASASSRILALGGAKGILHKEISTVHWTYFCTQLCWPFWPKIFGNFYNHIFFSKRSQNQPQLSNDKSFWERGESFCRKKTKWELKTLGVKKLQKIWIERTFQATFEEPFNQHIKCNIEMSVWILSHLFKSAIIINCNNQYC